jgi:AraC-like DNA-binding protein
MAATSLAIKPDTADVLTGVLGTLRLEGRVYCRTEFSAPWSVEFPPGDFAHFHAVERGGGWFRLKGERRAHAIAAGDLVVVAHGQGHVLCDDPRTKPLPLERLAETAAPDARVLRHGGRGAETHMTCGSFRFADRGRNPILRLLPPVIRVRARDGSAGGWLEPTLALLAHEARHARQGSGTILTRLTDVIFVQAVRSWVEEQPAGGAGWLGALRDPQVGAALGLIHREPERAWTVAGLAAEVGMSRSPFAAKFTELVGEPPLAYVTAWRMQVAAGLLRDGLPVAEVAARVAYESEAAFSRAFKRWRGASPSAYRHVA